MDFRVKEALLRCWAAWAVGLLGLLGFAQKVRLTRKVFSRKGAKRYRLSKGFSLRLGAFARETFLPQKVRQRDLKYFLCKAALLGFA